MKDKRIWIVTGCILVIGTGVTHYTRYCANNQGVAMMAKISAGAEETAVLSFAPASGQLDTEAGGVDVGMTASRAAPVTPMECRMTGDARLGNTASGSTTSGDAGPGNVNPGNMAYTAAPAVEAAGAFSSDYVAPVVADAVEGIMASDTAGFAGAVEGAAVSETTSEKDTPISPLTGARVREYKVSRIVDYHRRLGDLDIQILKIREEEMDFNIYPIKTSAETELKLWEGELNFIYNTLTEMLPQRDGTKLALGQQERLKNRDARATESSSRNGGSIEGISHAAALVSLTGNRAYELADRYEEASGVFYEDEDSPQAALSQQARAWKEQPV